MRLHSFATVCALFLSFAAVVHSAEPAADNPAPIRYQKEVAPIIAEVHSGFSQAKQKFQHGLPKGSELKVMVRLLDALERVVVVQLLVTKIEDSTSRITGRIVGDIPRLVAGQYKGDKITVHESQLVDWMIIHKDGNKEGGVFARFLAAQESGANVTRFLEDEESVTKREMLASPEYRRAIEQTFLQFFDDPALNYEVYVGPQQAIRTWPALTEKYKAVPAAVLTEQLSSRARALKGTLRTRVEHSNLVTNGKPTPMVILSVFVVIKRGSYVFEVQQYLHFQYVDTETLGKVVWGLNFVRPIKPKAQAG